MVGYVIVSIHYTLNNVFYFIILIIYDTLLTSVDEVLHAD